MSVEIEICLIAIVVCMSCSILGIFLVLKNMTMMADAITHTVILGIVLAFFFVHDLSSPLLIIGASIIGVITVWLSETLRNTKLISEDSSIGIIFPFLFSIAVILITKYTGSVHLDTDSVLLGELAFAPFNRLVIAGVDIGPWILYQSIIVFALNALFVWLFYKELKLSIFDSVLGKILGFAPTIIHYVLMTLVSITTVSSFEAVGAILVVSFIVGPPITAYLLAIDLKKIILYSFVISVINSILGCIIANIFDVSIAGSIATVCGITFLFTFVFSPRCGIITVFRRKIGLKIEFAKLNLLVCVNRLENEQTLVTVYSISECLNWNVSKTKYILRKLRKKSEIIEKETHIYLTDIGKENCVHSYNQIVCN